MYVELPDVGTEIEKGQSTGAVESVKVSLLLSFASLSCRSFGDSALCYYLNLDVATLFFKV